MRFLDPTVARVKFPHACAGLTNEEVSSLVHRDDNRLYLMDPAHYGFSHLVWIPVNKLTGTPGYWAPHIRKLA